jgi:deoxycytidylate deaminase
MKRFFTELINIIHKQKIEKSLPEYDFPCKTCRYHSINSGVCTIFNRQSQEARKIEFLCGKYGEFYREIKIEK